jgi:ABC-2 type transport system ATP-binding protein
MSAVETVGLRKRFGKTEALCGVDIAVERATVLGVLGPNGAGKTTLVRILCTLLKPDAGKAFIDGIDVVKDPRRARARIGLTGQYAAVDERLTGKENLEHVGRLFHRSTHDARLRAAELLERFDLVDARDQTVKTYSGGMRRRLDIAMSLTGKPSILFLDEPTTGLDPRSRNTMWDLIDELVHSGVTTLLTTQYLEEADRLTDEIVVIDHGLVIETGTAAELKHRVGGERIEVIVERATDAPRVVEVLAPLSVGPAEISDDRRTVLVPVTTVERMVPVVVRELDTAGIAVQDVGIRRSTLDDVFFALTGRKSDDEGDATVAAPEEIEPEGIEPVRS